MGDPPKKAFLQFWPKCFIPFMAVIELLAALILLLTELGNVAANFWTTNVFAGGWCGLVILIHSIAVFASGKKID
jgi:sorbitol-specific phosphotransferase system component IIBC